MLLKFSLMAHDFETYLKIFKFRLTAISFAMYSFIILRPYFAYDKQNLND